MSSSNNFILIKNNIYWYLKQQRRRWHPTPVLLPGGSHGWRSLVGCSPRGLKESDTTERLHLHFFLSFFGEGNGNPLWYSCLEDPMDGGAWWATVHRVAKSQRRLSDFTHSPNLRSFLSLFLQMYFLYRFPSLHLLRFQ